MIAFLANQKLYHTGYLALTRGDGGQNLIGSEIRERLGIIRTQELLQARRTDGGEQFFTRANDFGFSKNPEEVFSIWDKKTLLGDVVWVIRNFKPDVIITRFPKDARAGHGQHSASSILAEEAFTVAADPNAYPEQLKFVKPWQAKRIVWNMGNFGMRDPQEFEKIKPTLTPIETGMFNPLLGKSYGEISALSRSMHKSQAFGATGTRGNVTDYFEHTAGPKAKLDIFEDVNTTWARLGNTKAISDAISKAIATYNPSNPAAVVPSLLVARTEINKLPNSYWKTKKLEELQEVIRTATGLYLEAVSESYSVVPGEALKIKTEAINRSKVPMKITSIEYPFSGGTVSVNESLTESNRKNYNKEVLTPKNLPISQPYWLEKPDTLGMFDIKDQHNVGLPENKPAANVTANVNIGGQDFKFVLPVVFKRNDLVLGELYQALAVTPPVFANIAENVYMFTGNTSKEVTVYLKAGKANVQGEVSLKLPQGWQVSPAAIPVNIQKNQAEQTAIFTVTPPANTNVAEMQAVVTVNNEKYNRGIKKITYNHIPEQVIFPLSTAKAVKVELEAKGKNIGYLMGAGDDVPTALTQIGYNVTILQDADFNPATLSKFDAILVGVRAYNTLDRIDFYNNYLTEYAKNGGNVIIQYNTNSALKMNPGPYPIKLSTDRVTDEVSEVRILAPQHAAFNTPNKITQEDFKGWVQERGLYFPSEWDKNYEALISINDPKETPKNSSILVAKYGKGNFVYTGISWFRQLPAGVPGAYRLFSNLISLGK